MRSINFTGSLRAITFAVALIGCCVTSAQAADPIKKTPIKKLEYVPNQLCLAQGLRGSIDAKRNVVNQPFIHEDAAHCEWVLDRVPDSPAEAYYICNVKTGLVLTQDGDTDRNVSGWGRETGNIKQHWILTKCTGDKVSQNTYMITNKATGLALVQSWMGTKLDKNVCTWDGNDPNNPAYQWRLQASQPVEMVKIRLEKVRCIKPSTGKDGGTKFLFAVIEMTIEAGITASTGGASSAGTVAAKEAVKAALKVSVKEAGKVAIKEATKMMTVQAAITYARQTAVKTAVKKAALEAGNSAANDDADSLVELAFDQIYGESPDQLEIKINGTSVWPNGGRDWRKIKSQETMNTDVVFIAPRNRETVIQLIEYDSGSGDDNLGHLTLDTSEVTEREVYEQVVIKHDKEGSVYEITFSVEPMEWQDPDQFKDNLNNAVLAKPIEAAQSLFIGAGFKGRPKRAFGMEDGRIVAIQSTGQVNAYSMGPLVHRSSKYGNRSEYSMRPTYRLPSPGALPGGTITPGRYYIAIGNQILTIDAAGDTWAHDITDTVGPAKQIPGAKVAITEKYPKAVFAFGHDIAVLSSTGELWVHPLSEKVGEPYRFGTDTIDLGRHSVKAAFVTAGNLILVTSIGNGYDMWRFELKDKSFGPKTKVEGLKVPPGDPLGIIPAPSQIIIVDYGGHTTVQNFKRQ